MLGIWIAIHAVAAVALIAVLMWRRREDRLELSDRVEHVDGDKLDVDKFLELLGQ